MSARTRIRKRREIISNRCIPTKEETTMQESGKNFVFKIITGLIVFFYVLAPVMAIILDKNLGGVARVILGVVYLGVGLGVIHAIFKPREVMDAAVRARLSKLVGVTFILVYGIPFGILMTIAWWSQSPFYGVLTALATLVLAGGLLALVIRSKHEA